MFHSGDNVYILDDKGEMLGGRTFCGPTAPGTFVIDGKFARIGFKSATYGGGYGFKAVWVYRGLFNS